MPDPQDGRLNYPTLKLMSVKLAITLLVIANTVLSFLHAQPPQHAQGGNQGQRGQGGHGMHHPPVPPLWIVIDENQDGSLSAAEIAKAAKAIGKLDTNGDGIISLTELPPPPHAQQGQGGQQGRHHRGGGQQGGPHAETPYYNY